MEDDHEELTLDDWKAAVKAACRDAEFWEQRARGWQTRLLAAQTENASLQASWEQKVQELAQAQAELAKYRRGTVDDLTERREARGNNGRTTA